MLLAGAPSYGTSIPFELTTDGLHALPAPGSIWREILLKRADGIDVKSTD